MKKYRYYLKKWQEITNNKQTMNTSKQLTPFQGYNTDNMIFGTPVPSITIPGNFYIPISTKYPDGTTGNLILPTAGRLFSFGVSENKSPETGEVSGWSFPLCLYNRDGPTEEQEEWVDTYNRIVKRISEHLIDVAPEMGKEITESELSKTKGGLNPLYWKREQVKDEKTGKTVFRVVPGTGPTFYPKLIYSKGKKKSTPALKGGKDIKKDSDEHEPTGKFISRFFDMKDQPIDPLGLQGKYCYSEAAIIVESIFIGKNASIQNKLYEAVVEVAESSMTRLMHAPRPKANSSVLEFKQSGDMKLPNPLSHSSNTDADGDGSIGSDDEKVESSSKPKTTTTSTTSSTAPVRNIKKVVPGAAKTKAKAIPK